MTRSLALCAAALLAATAALADNYTGANPSATYCYGGGTVGSVGGGPGNTNGPVCTYANVATSFGNNYYTNTKSSQYPGTACSSDPGTVVAQHLISTGHALSTLQPALGDDDNFLITAGEVPAATVLLDTTDALSDFSVMPDVPGTFSLTDLAMPPTPGSASTSVWPATAAGHFKGCGSTVMEANLHRTWAAFGNSYYYGDPGASSVSDPANFSYFACWTPNAGGSSANSLQLGVDKAYQYRRWGVPNDTSSVCQDAGYTGFDLAQCVWCVSHPTRSVPDPRTWNGTAATGTTTGSGYGYYVTSNARSTLNHSVYWSGAVIDYPPMFVPMWWTAEFIANNSMTDLTGQSFLFPFRRQVRLMYNNMPSGACGTSSTVVTNGMHPSCARTNPYQGDNSFSSVLSNVNNNFSNIYLNPNGSSTSLVPGGTDLPLAGSLFDTVRSYVSGGLRPSGNNEGWCSTCAQNHLIVLSAGEVCHDPGQIAISSDVDTSVSCTGSCAHQSASCTVRGSLGNYTCGGSNPVWAPQIASYVFNNDLVPASPGNQNLRVDAIALGPNSAALQQAAQVGGGTYIDASAGPSQIHDALFSVLNGLIRASVSATSTPVNSVQASAGAQEELVALFTPKNQQSIWDGHLVKYYFFSEFAQGCTSQGQAVNFPDGASSATTIRCPCLGAQCSGRYSVDGNLNFVVRANDGTFHAFTYSQLTSFFTANNRYPTPEEALDYPLATPVWDVAQIMQGTPWYNRVAYTIIDSSGDGKVAAPDDALYQITLNATTGGVTDTVADTLTPYLGIVGNALCAQIAAISSTGVTYPDLSNVTNRYRSCAKGILNFALGQDLLNSNGGGSNNRLYMLGDIYHSTPIDIGPPVSEQFCQFNTRRCTPTLFNGVQGNQSNATAWQALEFPSNYINSSGTPVSGTAGVPGPIDAYQVYVNKQTFTGTGGNPMPQVRLFGANDGWVHAIQFACYAGLDSTTNTPIYYGGPGHGQCTRTVANGTELWAFIPPDLLAKLPQLLLSKHQVFVDGTPMVRDVYSGSDALKRLTDFHTVVIVGERNGGNRWFALDVTDPTAPGFRWIFPQVGSIDELRAGLSWGDYLPGSPPIGPVRLSSGVAGSPTYNGTPFHETWVVALPGGYDHYGMAGHGLWMLDAWTGAKYWEAWGLPGQDFAFAGLPSMTNWGTSESMSVLGPLPNNGFFDTMVVADTGGTLWAARFNEVGALASSANANGETLVNNWAMARSFRQANADDSGVSPYKMQRRTPFFSMPSLGRMADSGFLRAFLGSGDRGNVADQYLGTCSSSNLLACGKQAVVAMNERDRDVGSSTLRGGFVSYDGTINANLSVGGTLTYSSSSASACTPASQSINGCLKTTSAQVNTVAPPNEPQQACVNTATGLSCSTINASGLTIGTGFNSSTGQNGSSSSVYSTAGNGYYPGFYAITVFKPSPSSRTLFASTTATTYDSARITEASTACSSTPVNGLCKLYPNGLLANYTFPEQSSSFRTASPSDGTTDGYYFRYPNIDEKTSGNTLLSQGCVLWSSVQPTSPCDTDADCAAFAVDQAGGGVVVSGQCNTAAHECVPSTQCNVVGGSSAGHIYQINAGLGTADCALVGQAVPRVTFGTILPPPPPQSVALVNPSGSAIQYAVVTPAGLSGTLLQPKAGGGQLFRPYYSIEVPQATHSCRHAGTCY